MIKKFLKNIIINLLEMKKNKFHPMTFIKGNPKIGNNVYIGLFSEVMSWPQCRNFFSNLSMSIACIPE